MKLIQKINQRYIIYSIITLVLMGIVLFFTLRIIIDEETDEKLEITCLHIERLLSEKKEVFVLEPFILVEFAEIIKEDKYFSDTMIYMESQEHEEFRQLTVFKEIGGISYKIIIRESILESEDLLETLSVIILISLIVLFILFYLINNRVSISVWLPFYNNLEKLKNFSLQKMVKFKPENSNIDEFRELNIVLKSLTNKVINDYEILKKFSENASHELQTPLAIMRSKIETLLEDTTFRLPQIEKIQAIYQSINRLTKINKGLLLLTKIENQQFTNLEDISLNNFIMSQIDHFKELMEIRDLKLNYSSHSDWIVNCDKTLFEILLNNLFSNAIMHNIPGGDIQIFLQNRKLTFSNSGTKAIENANLIFDRFYKGAESGSSGLGLAISKQICIALGLQISYDFLNEMHVFYIQNNTK